jgi:hypothetical protein
MAGGFDDGGCEVKRAVCIYTWVLGRAGFAKAALLIFVVDTRKFIFRLVHTARFFWPILVIEPCPIYG